MTFRVSVSVFALCAVFAVPAWAKPPTYASMANASLGQGASLHGDVPFPADNAWNTDISNSPVDPRSAKILKTISIDNGLHPDFGAGTYAGAIIGIPYYVVDNSQ